MTQALALLCIPALIALTGVLFKLRSTLQERDAWAVEAIRLGNGGDEPLGASHSPERPTGAKTARKACTPLPARKRRAF